MTMHAELTMRHTSPHAPARPPLDGMRIVSLLPREWSRHLRQTAGEEIVIRVDTDDDSTGTQVQATVTAALRDPALRHWSLSVCHPLTPGTG